MSNKKLTMLMILDGFGMNEKAEGNAVKIAQIPELTEIFTKNPNTMIHTSGLAVGLPEGQMGNSEVGHTNIGAGRIIYQDLAKITKSIEDGDFFSKPEFVKAIENCKANNSKLHIMGLLSDGGVHSHNRHLYGLLELAKRKDFEDVYVHCFMDGRDTPPASGEGYLIKLEDKLKEKGVGQIASLSGRFYAMDRDKRWERVNQAYDALVNGVGETATDAVAAIEESYQKEVFDEFVKPTVIVNKSGEPVAKIEDGDSVIFFNFRPDRAREITRCLVDKEFDGFETKKMNLYFVCMTPYDETMPNVEVAFRKEEIRNTFGEYISKKGLKQLRIAETEKYAHVTFFFNGGEEKQYEGEDRILVPSPKVETYDLKPEMSVYEVTDNFLSEVENFDVTIMNLANGDMVGHTGVYEAAKKAVEDMDICITKIYNKVEELNGILIIIADHGNCDMMWDENKLPVTSHTTNPVPCIITKEGIELNNGKLADVAPTMLELLGLPIPEEMTGTSLIKN